MGRQWLGRCGKTDSGVVTVTTLWADERVYYPVHAVPYTPARHFAKGRNDPGFRTKLAIGADLAARAQAAGFVFRAVAADCVCGDQDGLRGELAEAGLPYVMALKPRRGRFVAVIHATMAPLFPNPCSDTFAFTQQDPSRLAGIGILRALMGVVAVTFSPIASAIRFSRGSCR